MGDEGSSITADDAHNEVHATSFALAAHNAVGDVADQESCQYRPCSKICDVFKHTVSFTQMTTAVPLVATMSIEPLFPMVS